MHINERNCYSKLLTCCSDVIAIIQPDRSDLRSHDNLSLCTEESWHSESLDGRLGLGYPSFVSADSCISTQIFGKT